MLYKPIGFPFISYVVTQSSLELSWRYQSHMTIESDWGF